MHAWKEIETTLDYIEIHIKEELEINALAEMAHLSPFYYQRLFKRLVGKSVMEYIKLRKLASMLHALDDRNRTILDIAIDYGYSTHSNFTRAFKQIYTITPDEYRKNKPMLNSFDKPELATKYILVEENVPFIIDHMVLEIERIDMKEEEQYYGFQAVIQIAHQTPPGIGTGVDQPGQLWKKYHEHMPLNDIIDTSISLGMSYSANKDTGEFTYFAGGKAKAGHHSLHEGMVQHALPMGTYVVCKIEAETFEMLVTKALNCAYAYVFGTWLKKHKLETEAFSAEKYIQNEEGVFKMELWLPLKA